MEKPWLSVVVPVHNGARWLAAALQSVADQRDAGIECIVIDSSEGDDCVEIARRFSGTVPMQTHRRRDVLPWPAKTNLGVEAARAPHVAMLHQDDLWVAGRAAAARRWIAETPRAALHLNPSLVVDEGGRRLGVWHCPLPTGEAVPAQMFLERLLVQNFISIPAPVFRRDAYLAVGGMDVDLWYTADWDLYLKLGQAGDVHYRSPALTCFRVHRGSLTAVGSRTRPDFAGQMRTVLDRHSPRLLPERRKAVLPIAEASIHVNDALAAAASGRPAAIFGAALRLAKLGPLSMAAYFRDSRLAERVVPRVRAGLLSPR